MTDALIAALATLSTATVHEAAGKIGALPSAIKPLSPSLRLCGYALPVKSPPGDNLFLHHAIYAAKPGDVLVVDCGGGAEFGYWGEVMAVAAQARQIAGLVINGGVRDSQRMIELQFPVFAATICIRGTNKDPHGDGTIGAPLRIGDTDIIRGDLVLGDADGVVVIPAMQARQVIDESRKRDEAEQTIFEKLKAGQTTLEVYGLPNVKL